MESRFREKREATLWYYRSLVNVFRRKKPNCLAKELERVFAELETIGGSEQSSETRRARRKEH